MMCRIRDAVSLRMGEKLNVMLMQRIIRENGMGWDGGHSLVPSVVLALQAIVALEWLSS
jgi:hypothetical protein